MALHTRTPGCSILQPAWLPLRGMRDRRGAVAVTVAISILALVGIAAIAVDGSQALSARTKLSLAADEAALATLRSAAAIYAADPGADLTPAQDAGTQRFRAQASGLSQVSVPAVSAVLSHDGPVFTAQVNYSAQYSTWLTGVLGASNGTSANFATIPLGGTSKAQETAGSFVDIYVLMDVSNSMAIGADDAGRSELMRLTTQHPLYVNGYGGNWPNCAIACHMQQPLQPGWAQDYGDYYLMAKVFGIVLRIDVLKSAVNYVASMLATTQHPENFKFALYTFETDVHEIYPLGVPSGASPSIMAQEVTPINDWGVYNQTNVAQSIATFSNHVGVAGNGATAQTARKYAFILTDGVEDFTGTGGGRVTIPFDPKVCQNLKDRGVVVLVLQTTSDDPNNQFGENALLQQVQPLLQQCASGPDLFTAASTPAEINAAIRSMVNFAVATPSHFVQ